MVFRAAGVPGLTQPTPPRFPGPAPSPANTAPFGPVDLPAPLISSPEDWVALVAATSLCSVMPRAQLWRLELAPRGKRLTPAASCPSHPGAPFAVQKPRLEPSPQDLRPWQDKVPRCPLVLCVHLSGSFNFSVLAAPTSWPINIFFVISKTNLKKKKKRTVKQVKGGEQKENPAERFKVL